jgi:hypothetical protein
MIKKVTKDLFQHLRLKDDKFLKKMKRDEWMTARGGPWAPCPSSWSPIYFHLSHLLDLMDKSSEDRISIIKIIFCKSLSWMRL